MRTKYIKINNDKDLRKLRKPADILRYGGLVAFPTETVYGLGANGLDGQAVNKIFEAKGRPNDNPLILHISDLECIDKLACEITDTAKILMDNFWPGPMTLVFKKTGVVPKEVSAGLKTVGLRFPENKIAHEFIKLAGVPVAAPSANTSGRPSPTKASHVKEDMDGKIDVIIDGGQCDIGLESTVIDVTSELPVILRPGKITIEDIRRLVPGVEYDRHLVEHSEVVKPKSPGMKYKHYAPKGELYILTGSPENVKKYILSHYNESTGIITFDETFLSLPNEFSVGSINDSDSAAKNLFDILRKFDDNNCKVMYGFMPDDKGVGFAVCNRLLKAAGGRIIDADKI